MMKEGGLLASLRNVTISLAHRELALPDLTALAFGLNPDVLETLKLTLLSSIDAFSSLLAQRKWPRLREVDLFAAQPIALDAPNLVEFGFSLPSSVLQDGVVVQTARLVREMSPSARLALSRDPTQDEWDDAFALGFQGKPHVDAHTKMVLFLESIGIAWDRFRLNSKRVWEVFLDKNDAPSLEEILRSYNAQEIASRLYIEHLPDAALSVGFQPRNNYQFGSGQASPSISHAKLFYDLIMFVVHDALASRHCDASLLRALVYVQGRARADKCPLDLQHQISHTLVQVWPLCKLSPSAIVAAVLAPLGRLRSVAEWHRLALLTPWLAHVLSNPYVFSITAVEVALILQFCADTLQQGGRSVFVDLSAEFKSLVFLHPCFPQHVRHVEGSNSSPLLNLILNGTGYLSWSQLLPLLRRAADLKATSTASTVTLAFNSLIADLSTLDTDEVAAYIDARLLLVSRFEAYFHHAFTEASCLLCFFRYGNVQLIFDLFAAWVQSFPYCAYRHKEIAAMLFTAAESPRLSKGDERVNFFLKVFEATFHIPGAVPKPKQLRNILSFGVPTWRDYARLHFSDANRSALSADGRTAALAAMESLLDSC